MLSRRTSIALAFACLATLSLTVTAKVQRTQQASAAAPVASAPMAVIDLPRVVVTGRVTATTTP